MSNLWDDSALINAFNHAVTKYKTMHGKNICNDSSENEKNITNDTASVPAVDDEIHKEKRPVEEVDSGSFEFVTSTNLGEANNLPSFEGNYQTYSDISEPNMHTENVPHPQEARDGPESSEGADKYNNQMNQLLKQYNELSLEVVDKYNQLNHLAKEYSELESQRQNVLEQLRQVGYSDPYSSLGADYSSYAQPGTCYPSSSQYAQWGTFASSSEGYQVPKHQAYNPAGSHPFLQPNDPAAVYPPPTAPTYNPAVAYPPPIPPVYNPAAVFPHPTTPIFKPVAVYLHPISLPFNSVAINSHCQVGGPCLTAPCPEMVGCPCCAYCDSKMSKDHNCVPSFKGTGRISPSEDERVVRTVTKAADKALSSMTKKDPGPSNLNEDTVREKKVLSGLLEGEMAESMNSPPDLKVVLDAWYSAGFYTSKYLLKQSMRKDGTDGSSP